MITALHDLVYADDAEAARAFFRDVLGWPHVDVHDGWLIFRTGPSELGVHPAPDGGGAPAAADSRQPGLPARSPARYPSCPVRYPGRADAAQPPPLLRPAMRLMVTARITAPNRKDSSACRRVAERIVDVCRSVSETWNVMPTVSAT